MLNQIKHSAKIPEELASLRLDTALVKLFPEYSRAKLQHWIQTQKITVDGKFKRRRDKVLAGQTIEIDAKLEPVIPWVAQAIDLNVIYEDENILVINKPAGLIVHPGAGNSANTLVNALLNYYPLLEQLPRAGLIHRLDKDTSGLLVIAKTIMAHTSLVKMMEKREISREYAALIEGKLIAGGSIDQPIGRHPIHRTRMAVIESGKEAITHYRILEKFRSHTFLKVILETGRTHQIRVHMAWIHHSLVGDSLYGWRLRLPSKASPELINTLRNFKRQALHAHQLSLQHPCTQKTLTWKAPIPEDMLHLIELLRIDNKPPLL